MTLQYLQKLLEKDRALGRPAELAVNRTHAQQLLVDGRAATTSYGPFSTKTAPALIPSVERFF
jgi:hypothetical protein